eukprot:3841878-Pleurochrysis_carterae.AAC.2
MTAPPAATTMALPLPLETMGGTLSSGLDHHIGLRGHAKRKPAYVVEHDVLVTLGVHVQHHASVVLRKFWRGGRAPVNVVAGHNLSHGAHALKLVGFGVASALARLVVLVALESCGCSSRSTGWAADEGEFLGRLL